jgi:hypothetical protein
VDLPVPFIQTELFSPVIWAEDRCAIDVAAI